MANDLRLEPKRGLTRRDIRRQKARFRGDLIICLGLYVSLVCIYLLIVRAVNHQALLTGEESTVSSCRCGCIDQALPVQPLVNKFWALPAMSVGHSGWGSWG